MIYDCASAYPFPVQIAPITSAIWRWGEPSDGWLADLFDYNFCIDMTAILMWREGKEAFIAADGMAWSDKGNHYQYDLKTARVNNLAAIAARGDTCFSNQILGHCFGVYDETQVDRWPHFIEELEKRGIDRPDLDLEGISRIVSGCCAEIARAIEEAKQRGKRFVPFEGDIVLLSSVSGSIAAYGWRAEGNYVREGVNLSNPVVLAPGGAKTRKSTRKLLARTNLSPEKRVKRSMKIISAQSDSVNENATLRRASRGFELERLY